MHPSDVADATAQDLLTRLAGPDAVLRPDQAAAIGALVDAHRRVLLVQATGWGKSAVYWIATALRRARGAGPTLVVSPLLALMRDQVAAARRIGLDAETVNSANPDEWDAILDRLADHQLDVLLISPERLNAPTFRPYLHRLAPHLGLLVVDEAHCISDWGHDFRPDYRRIRDVLDRLPPDSPVLACTATANARVVEDVAAQLGDRTVTLRGPLARTSLRLAVVRLDDAETRLAWLDAFVRRHHRVHGRAGVVYTLTVADAERTADFLRGRGLEVAAYTSAVAPEDRERVERALGDNDLEAVVATSALGMGYDKPDLAFVVHLGAPSSPVAYYQQVGRAGRAIGTAEVVLLPTGADRRIWHHFDVAGIPGEAEAAAVIGALRDDDVTSVPQLETMVDVRRTRLELLLKVLDVDGAVVREGRGYRRTGRPWTYDRDRYDRLLALRRAEHDAMARLVAGEVEGCLMAELAGWLDDPDPAPCGRCQGCVGWTPAVEVDAAVVAEARTMLRTRDAVLPPRRRWPSGLDEVRGTISVGRRAEVGRVLADGDGSGWSGTVTGLLRAHASGDADRYARHLDEAVAGLTGVLARWDWPRRPEAVVALPSRTYPGLAADVAARLGALGRLPVVDALRRGDGPSQAVTGNSAHRSSNALRRVHRAGGADLGGARAVLVVDVAVDTGWTMTVAAWRLTEDAERVVLPLVLSRR